jgi:DNA adenine methylase
MSKLTSYSPLRYPGGKGKMASFLEKTILLNSLEDSTLVEIYAGGAGASLNLLVNGVCKKLILNDFDPHIYAFWKVLFFETDDFLRKINDTIVSIKNWHEQKEIYTSHNNYSDLDVAFSTFYLNRTNRSGILAKAGPIGGYDQKGNYKLDVRFNKLELNKRIGTIAKFSDKVEIHNKDGIELVKELYGTKKEKYFIFLDPPYYNQGKNLYLNFYNNDDHLKLARILKLYNNQNWLLTYDNCLEIKEMYKRFRSSDINMTYTLQDKKQAKEIMIVSDSLHLPKTMKLGSNNMSLSLSITE